MEFRAQLSPDSTIYDGPLRSHPHIIWGMKFTFSLGQMNELDEALVSTETRKKKRRLGFRYSSRKVLQHSRVKRETSKVGGFQLESVIKALSFPCDIVDTVHNDCAPGSSLQPCLDSVEEHDGDEIELRCGNTITSERYNIKVSIMSFFDEHLNLKED